MTKYLYQLCETITKQTIMHCLRVPNISLLVLVRVDFELPPLLPELCLNVLKRMKIVLTTAVTVSSILVSLIF